MYFLRWSGWIYFRNLIIFCSIIVRSDEVKLFKRFNYFCSWSEGGGDGSQWLVFLLCLSLSQTWKYFYITSSLSSGYFPFLLKYFDKCLWIMNELLLTMIGRDTAECEPCVAQTTTRLCLKPSYITSHRSNSPIIIDWELNHD